MTEAEKPIGVFDSGIGGVSVLRELVRVMPEETFLFLGDSANAPYGVRPPEEARALTEKCIGGFLKRGVKEIVIACNTATSAAAKELRTMYPQLPIIGIEPALKPAVLAGKNQTVVVMATPLTLQEEKFRLLMARYQGQATVLTLPCFGLVELVERGVLAGPEMDACLAELVRPFKKVKVDSVVLGCTHYPHARAAIQKAFGEGVTLYDGGDGTAREARRQLAVRGLLAPSGSAGRVEFHFTKDEPRMTALACSLLYR